MDTRDWYEIRAVIPLAWRPIEPGTTAGLDNWGKPTPMSDRARLAISRIGRERNDTRDALRALVDTIAHLEGEIDQLTRRLFLSEQGLEPVSQLVAVSGGALALDRDLGVEPSTPVQLFLCLHVRGREHILAVRGRVASRATDHTRIAFTEITTDQRDLVVAFVFQQQAKERRRELATRDPDLRPAARQLHRAGPAGSPEAHAQPGTVRGP